MTALTTMTETSFDSDLARSPVPVLVDFWAENRPPCTALAPLLQQLTGQTAGRLRIGTVRLDDNPGLAARFNILAAPTLILFIDGKPAGRLTAINNRQDLADQIQPYLAH